MRVEDTDQSGEVEGVLAQFDRTFDYFGIQSTEGEGDCDGGYGPYHRSARERVYLIYVRQLLRQNKVYLRFATHDELADITQLQYTAKIPPGYYGIWGHLARRRPEQVRAELETPTWMTNCG